MAAPQPLRFIRLSLLLASPARSSPAPSATGRSRLPLFPHFPPIGVLSIAVFMPGFLHFSLICY